MDRPFPPTIWGLCPYTGDGGTALRGDGIAVLGTGHWVLDIAASDVWDARTDKTYESNTSSTSSTSSTSYYPEYPTPSAQSHNLPMLPKVVSFDCAQTLLEVDWSVRRYVADICAHIGLEIPLEGPSIYERMYQDRRADYTRVNMARDHALCLDWWVRLGEDWLGQIGLDPALANDLQDVSEEIGFGPTSVLFKLYEDVIPTLDRLDQLGIRVAVLSNWDYSLHKSLRGMGIYDRFELVVASLEEGFEKPDPRMFQLVTDHFGVEPNEVLHVGDNPEDDHQGATNFGMRATLIDRGLHQPDEPWINDLREIEGVFGWT